VDGAVREFVSFRVDSVLGLKSQEQIVEKVRLPSMPGARRFIQDHVIGSVGRE